MPDDSRPASPAVGSTPASAAGDGARLEGDLESNFERNFEEMQALAIGGGLGGLRDAEGALGSLREGHARREEGAGVFAMGLKGVYGKSARGGACGGGEELERDGATDKLLPK